MAKKKYDKWEVESAADTLSQAEKIKSNKPLLKLARAELKRRIKSDSEVLKKIAEK